MADIILDKITVKASASDEQYDVQGALTYGIPLEEVTAQVGFDLAGARAAGISDEDIKNELVNQQLNPTPMDPYAQQPAPLPEEEPGFVDKVLGAGEAALTLATGATGGLLGTVIGTGAAITEQTKRRIMGDPLLTDKQFEDYASAPAQAMTYEPRGEVGKAIIGKIAEETAVLGYFHPMLSELSTIGQLGKAAKPQIITDIDTAFNLNRPKMQKVEMSPGAKLLAATHVDIPDEQIQKIINGVPPEDQALHIAMAAQDPQLIEHALRTDRDRAKLAKLLNAPTKAVMEVLGDTGKKMLEAKVQYHDMVKYTAETSDGKLRPVPELQGVVNDLLEQFYLQPNRAQGTLRRLAGQVERNGGNLSLLDAVEMMPDITALISKAKSHNERAMLQKLKDTMEDSIEKLGTPEHKKMYDDARQSYAFAKNDEEVAAIINKNTTKMGRGTNWHKVHKEMQEAGIRSPDVADAMRMVEQFSIKYGNNTELSNSATVQGVNMDTGGLMGMYSYAVNKVRNVFLKDRREAGKIQKEILSAIRRNNSELDFLNEILHNPKVPDDIKYAFGGTSNWVDQVRGKSPEELLAMAQNDGAVDEVMANAMKANFAKLRDSGIEIHADIADDTGINAVPIGVAAKAEAVRNNPDIQGGNFYDNGVVYNWFKAADIPDEDKAVLVAHELNHTATRGGLAYARSNPGTPQGQALASIEGLMDSLKQADPSIIKKPYMANVQEFVSYAMTDPKLKEKLIKFEYDYEVKPEVPKSFWDELLDSMWEIQGNEMGPARDAYSQMVDRTLTVMEKNHKSYDVTGVETTAHMFDTRDLGLDINQEAAVKQALNLGAKDGNYKHITKLPKTTRQSLADELFNSRDFDTAKGLTGNQTATNVDYVGFTTKMQPSAFLKLAANRNNTLVDYIENLPMKGYDLDIESKPYKNMVNTLDKIARKNNLTDVREAIGEGDFEQVNDLLLEHGLGEQVNKAMGIGSTRVPNKAKDFAHDIAKDLAGSSSVKLGPPKLWGDIKDGKIVINGHEGRHRSDAAMELLGNDVSIPVDFQLTDGGMEMRRRNIDASVLDLPLVNQDGSKLNLTLRKLLPAGFDTSRLGGN